MIGTLNILHTYDWYLKYSAYLPGDQVEVTEHHSYSVTPMMALQFPDLPRQLQDWCLHEPEI